MDLDELRALTPSAAIDHIVSEHHEPLRRQLAELERACTALTSGGALTGAALSVVDLARLVGEELGQHMLKEERLAFRMIATTGGFREVPLAVMEREHRYIDELVRELGRKTDGFTPSPGAPHALARLFAVCRQIALALPAQFAQEEALYDRFRSASEWVA